jgi:hypothetical protein
LQEQGSLTPEILEANRQVWLVFAERFNLLSLLRTIPVGIPSLMVNRSPIETPLGAPMFLDLNDFLSISGFALLAVFLGLSASALFFLLVAQLSTQSELDWRLLLREWPRALLRSFGLMFMLFAVLMIITVPFSCLLGILALSGMMFSQIGIFLYGIILAWWLFPLVFSAHGFFLYHEKLWHSIRRSIRLTRQTFPITGMLLLIVLLTSEGLDVLWNTPNEASWLMILGVVGHAFINTALLAGTFVYYREINRWLQSQQPLSLAPSQT